MSQQHVECILTAEFDIDAGPVIKHQHPSTGSINKLLMAELMLPDQIHARAEDWTIFFLYRRRKEQFGTYINGKKNATAELATIDKGQRDLGSEGTEEDDESVESKGVPRSTKANEPTSLESQEDHTEEKGNELVYSLNDIEDTINDVDEEVEKFYVLNFVNSKYDSQVKRGATVKAMAIVTRHQFFQVFKPLLMLALDQYFINSKDPGSVLEVLYESLNNIDMRTMPSFSPTEKLVLSNSELPHLYSNMFADIVPSPKDTHLFETKVSYRQMKIPLRIPTCIYPECIGDFSLIKLVSVMCRISGNSLQGSSDFSSMDALGMAANSGNVGGPSNREIQSGFRWKHHCPVLTVHGPHTAPLLVLINALLSEKRVLFIGLNTPSHEVSELVLACCYLASGELLRSFHHRAFPYTDLSKVDELLASPGGYIAGVKNPAFEHHPGWWDVIIDLENYSMKISPEIGESFDGYTSENGSNRMSRDEVPLSLSETEDVEFVEDLRNMIANHYGEQSIRLKCRQHIAKFIRMARNYEIANLGLDEIKLWPRPGLDDELYEIVSGFSVSSPVNPAYVPLIEAWRNTKSYQYYIRDVRTKDNLGGIDSWPYRRDAGKVTDFSYHVAQLRVKPTASAAATDTDPSIANEESASIYDTLYTCAKDYDDVNRLLSVCCVDQNLFYVALGLFHPFSTVRMQTAELLMRFENHPAGSAILATLSQFQKLAYKRLCNELR